MNWTKPYCGISHLLDLPRPHQITLEDRGSYVRVYHLMLVQPNPFTAKREAEFKTMKEAKAWGEQVAATFMILN